MNLKKIFFTLLILYSVYFVFAVKFNFNYYFEHGFDLGIFIMPIISIFQLPAELAIKIGMPKDQLFNCSWLFCSYTPIGLLLTLLINFLILIIVLKFVDLLIKAIKNIR